MRFRTELILLPIIHIDEVQCTEIYHMYFKHINILFSILIDKFIRIYNQNTIFDILWDACIIVPS